MTPDTLPGRAGPKPGSPEIDQPWTVGLDAFKRRIGADGYAEVAPPPIQDATPLGPTGACEKALRRAG